ncbi:hypothetical protein CALCODRAFT_289523 [Calocera cornea HHB12733]|uniref:Uncharacterized protein n=1 Tax=Calocera cornea HHB12733 TaxID=1353952 RepID=A0A165FWG7_9BASI|nr:hypothetical protein CALCODRAFT_289523 [Calocera cornea HHB12733]
MQNRGLGQSEHPSPAALARRPPSVSRARYDGERWFPASALTTILPQARKASQSRMKYGGCAVGALCCIAITRTNAHRVVSGQLWSKQQWRATTRRRLMNVKHQCAPATQFRATMAPPSLSRSSASAWPSVARVTAAPLSVRSHPGAQNQYCTGLREGRDECSIVPPVGIPISGTDDNGASFGGLSGCLSPCGAPNLAPSLPAPIA